MKLAPRSSADYEPPWHLEHVPGKNVEKFWGCGLDKSWHDVRGAP